MPLCLPQVHPKREVPTLVPFFLLVTDVGGQHSAEARLEWFLEGTTPQRQDHPCWNRYLTVISQRGSQKMLSEQSTSKTKGDAACEAVEALTQARERQEEARRLYEQKCEKTAESETKFNGTIMVTLQKAEALGKHA